MSNNACTTEGAIRPAVSVLPCCVSKKVCVIKGLRYNFRCTDYVISHGILQSLRPGIMLKYIWWNVNPATTDTPAGVDRWHDRRDHKPPLGPSRSGPRQFAPPPFSGTFRFYNNSCRAPDSGQVRLSICARLLRARRQKHLGENSGPENVNSHSNSRASSVGAWGIQTQGYQNDGFRMPHT